LASSEIRTARQDRLPEQTTPPEQARGGILADEMGLGKTLQVLALIAATSRAERERKIKKKERKLEKKALAAAAVTTATTTFASSNGVGGGFAVGTGVKKEEKEKDEDGEDEDDEKDSDAAHDAAFVDATLVVCPLSVIGTWEEQIGRHLDRNRITYTLYHGPKRERERAADFRNVDIVITTYNILSIEYGEFLNYQRVINQVEEQKRKLQQQQQQQQQIASTFSGADINIGVGSSDRFRSDLTSDDDDEDDDDDDDDDEDYDSSERAKARLQRREIRLANKKSQRGAAGGSAGLGGAVRRRVFPLLDTAWRRIILDEAHNIRDRKTRTCKAACALNAQRRWAVTGTPLQNRVSDIFSLLQFIQLHPLHKFEVFSLR